MGAGRGVVCYATMDNCCPVSVAPWVCISNFFFFLFPNLLPGELTFWKVASLPSCVTFVSLMPPTHNHPIDSVPFPVKPPSPICWQSSVSQKIPEAPRSCLGHTLPWTSSWIQDWETISPSPGVWSSAKSAIARPAHLTLLSPRFPKLSKPWNPPLSQYQLCSTKFPGDM